MSAADLPMGCTEGILTLALATFIPRLRRLSRREPRVQLPAAVWTGQVAMFGVSAAAHLLGLPSWTYWAPILGGVALAVVVLIWRGRDIVAGLRTPPPRPVEPPSTPGDPSAYVVDYPGTTHDGNVSRDLTR